MSMTLTEILECQRENQKNSDKQLKATQFLLSNIKYKQNTPEEIIFPNLPKTKYQIIYADPPWHYGQHWQYTRAGYEWWQGCDKYYPCVPTPELAKLKIHTITDKDCLLFMWTTSAHLSQALVLGEVWGFDYSTIAFIWDKERFNPSRYTMPQCEVCLLFKKGKIPSPRGARNIKQLVRIERSKNHSEKPSEVRKRITQMFPRQKKIELFARDKTNGWDFWGK